MTFCRMSGIQNGKTKQHVFLLFWQWNFLCLSLIIADDPIWRGWGIVCMKIQNKVFMHHPLFQFKTNNNIINIGKLISWEGCFYWILKIKKIILFFHKIRNPRVYKNTKFMHYTSIFTVNIEQKQPWKDSIDSHGYIF